MRQVPLVISPETATALDCLDSHVMVVSPDLKIVFANKAYLRQVGKSEEDVVGQACYSVTHGKDSVCKPPNDTCPIFDISDDNDPGVALHRHSTADGGTKEVYVAAVNFLDRGVKYHLHVAVPSKCDEEGQEEEEAAVKERVNDVLRLLVLLEPEAKS